MPILDTGQAGSLFRPRTDIGGAKGELGGVANIAKNVMYERWWRKELEDFDRVAIPKMKEAVTRLSELANDENFSDHAGAWAMMKSAVAAVQTEALKYPNNPYISTKSANMHKSLAGGFKEMTQGLKDMQGIRTAKEQQLTAKARREELMPAQIAASKMQTKAAKAQLEQAERSKSRRTGYGEFRGLATSWAATAEDSPRFKSAHITATKESANAAWTSELGQKYRDDMGVMGTKSDFIAEHFMTDTENQAFKKKHFTAAVAELGESPEIASSFLNDMIRSSPAKVRQEAARKPKVLPLPLREGTAALNKAGWDDPNAPAGSAADFRPMMTEKHYGSIYGQALASYTRARGEPNYLSHKEAVAQVWRSGAADRAINSRINTGNKAGQDTRTAYVREINDLLRAEEDNYFTEAAERRRERLISEGRYGGVAEPFRDWAEEYADWDRLFPSLLEAGKEAIFGREMHPAAQAYLKNVDAKGKSIMPGAAEAGTTVPPRIIETE